MRPYFRCRHCRGRLVPLVHSVSHHIWGQQRVCPRCGRVWRLGTAAHQVLLLLGIVGGIAFLSMMRECFRPPETNILVLALWLPLYVFIIWPAMFALIGNSRLR